MKKKKLGPKQCKLYGKTYYEHVISENRITGLKCYAYVAYKFNVPEKLDKNYCITIHHLYYPNGVGKTDDVNPLTLESIRKYWKKRND